MFAQARFGDKPVYLKQADIQFATDLESYIRNKPLKDYDPCLGKGVAQVILGKTKSRK